jgi:hypothetical protein
MNLVLLGTTDHGDLPWGLHGYYGVTGASGLAGSEG